MEQISILEWSLNLSSNVDAIIEDWVGNSLKDMNGKLPDIIFINEVVEENASCREFIARLKKNCDYNVVCSENIHGNQVAIAFSNKFKIANVVRRIPCIDSDYIPDFLHLEVEHGTKIYNLVAVRIRINSLSVNDKEFKLRKKQFEAYKTYIANLDNLVSAGDFNHSQIIGEEDDISQEKYWVKDNKGSFCYSQRDYNYQMIKSEIAQTDKKKILTPKDKSVYEGYVDLNSEKTKMKKGNLSSIGLKTVSETNRFLYPTINPNNNKYDHFIISEELCVEAEPYYDWRFLQLYLQNNNANSYFKKIYKDEKGYVHYVVRKGNPDHAQLRITINME